jgi:hypothetical protein
MKADVVDWQLRANKRYPAALFDDLVSAVPPAISNKSRNPLAGNNSECDGDLQAVRRRVLLRRPFNLDSHLLLHVVGLSTYDCGYPGKTPHRKVPKLVSTWKRMLERDGLDPNAVKSRGSQGPSKPILIKETINKRSQRQ